MASNTAHPYVAGVDLAVDEHADAEHADDKDADDDGGQEEVVEVKEEVVEVKEEVVEVVEEQEVVKDEVATDAEIQEATDQIDEHGTGLP